MPDDQMDEEADAGATTPQQMTDGLLAGHDRALEALGDHLLERAKPITRFVLKKLPGAPTLVYDATQLATSPNKTRTAFGLAGGLLGGAAGGALGTAAGGVNAPIGAALGATFGENLGDQIYDEHAGDIEATKRWIADRWRQLQGSAR